MNKPNIAKIFKDARTVITAHSPEILTGLGIAGMITSTVFAVRATPKALRRIEIKKQDEDKYELTAMETVKACWTCYIPAAVTGVTSVACLIGASSVSLRRNAALATAYKLSETALTEYREQVIDTIGEKKERTVREKVAKKQLEKAPVATSEVYITEKGNTKFLEPISMRYFKSDRDYINRVVNNLNNQMLHDICGYISLNDFYDEIGLAPSELGDKMGWNLENRSSLIDIEFHPHADENGDPCLILDYLVRPEYDDRKYS